MFVALGLPRAGALCLEDGREAGLPRGRREQPDKTFLEKPGGGGLGKRQASRLDQAVPVGEHGAQPCCACADLHAIHNASFISLSRGPPETFHESTSPSPDDPRTPEHTTAP